MLHHGLLIDSRNIDLHTTVMKNIFKTFISNLQEKTIMKYAITSIPGKIKDETEVKIDYLKKDIYNLKGLKGDIQYLKEGLTKFLQEGIPRSDKISHEIHDENKQNIHHEFRYLNLGSKTNYIPNINMRNFYVMDPVTRIL